MPLLLCPHQKRLGITSSHSQACTASTQVYQEKAERKACIASRLLALNVQQEATTGAASSSVHSLQHQGDCQ